MLPFKESPKYKNLFYASSVPSRMVYIVEKVYAEFSTLPLFSEREIKIIPSDDIFLDKYRQLFLHFGMLFYDQNRENELSAYAMFTYANREDRLYKNKNACAQSTSFDTIIMLCLDTVPEQYITSFGIIPFFERLGDIKPTPKQIHSLRNIAGWTKVYKNKSDDCLSYTSAISFGNVLLKNLPPCELDVLVGNHTIVFNDIFDTYVQKNSHDIVVYNNIKKHIIKDIKETFTLQKLKYGIINRVSYIPIIHVNNYKLVIKVTIEKQQDKNTEILIDLVSFEKDLKKKQKCMLKK